MKYFLTVLMLSVIAFGLGAFMADISSEVVTDYNLGVTDSYKLGGGNGNSVSVETSNTINRVYEDGSISLQPATPYAPVMGGSGQLTKLQLSK